VEVLQSGHWQFGSSGVPKPVMRIELDSRRSSPSQISLLQAVSSTVAQHDGDDGNQAGLTSGCSTSPAPRSTGRKCKSRTKRLCPPNTKAIALTSTAPRPSAPGQQPQLPNRTFCLCPGTTTDSASRNTRKSSCDGHCRGIPVSTAENDQTEGNQ
jgi:hypothetical protein